VSNVKSANGQYDGLQPGSPSFTLGQRQRHFVVLDMSRYVLIASLAESLAIQRFDTRLPKGRCWLILLGGRAEPTTRLTFRNGERPSSSPLMNVSSVDTRHCEVVAGLALICRSTNVTYVMRRTALVQPSEYQYKYLPSRGCCTAWC